MNNKKVTIGLVLYDGKKYLKYCLKSLINQDYDNIEFLFRDQSPNSEIYEYIKKELPEIFSKIKINKGENLMHSGGHNNLMNEMSGDYYICASNDMWYPENFISKIIEELEKIENQKYGTATCKLMYWNFEKIIGNNLEESKTNILDSCGISLTKGHHFFDLGQGEEDKGQYNNLKEIFGASGALTIFRRRSLEKIRYESEYYDELLHYKNDVDLAYRMQWSGEKCLFLPNIKVYHDRQISNKEKGLFGFLKNRRKQSKFAKSNSYLGHLIVLKKNFSKDFSMVIKIKTFLYCFKRFIFSLFFESYLLKEYLVIKKISAIINSKENKINRLVDAKDIEKFM